MDWTMSLFTRFMQNWHRKLYRNPRTMKKAVCRVGDIMVHRRHTTDNARPPMIISGLEPNLSENSREATPASASAMQPNTV